MLRNPKLSSRSSILARYGKATKDSLTPPNSSVQPALSRRLSTNPGKANHPAGSAPTPPTGGSKSAGPNASQSSGFPTIKFLGALAIAAPGATAYYVKKNPEFNPALLQRVDKWNSFREFVLETDVPFMKFPSVKEEASKLEKEVLTHNSKERESHRERAKVAQEVETTSGDAEESSDQYEKMDEPILDEPLELEESRSDESQEELVSKSEVDSEIEIADTSSDISADQTSSEQNEDDSKDNEKKSADEAMNEEFEASNLEQVDTKFEDASSSEEIKESSEDDVQPIGPVPEKLEINAMNETELKESLEKDEETLRHLRHELKLIEENALKTFAVIAKELDDEMSSESKALEKELEENLVQGIENLDLSSLRIRTIQLAVEMKNRSKYEAVRVIQALKKVEAKYTEQSKEVLKKQAELHQDVLDRQIRLAEERVHQMNEEEIEKVIAFKDKELSEALRKRDSALRAEYSGVLENEKKKAFEQMKVEFRKQVGQIKEEYLERQNKRLEEVNGLKLHVKAMNDVLEGNSSYEAVSHQIHKVSVAALALANQLETSNPIHKEVECLKAAGKGDFLLETVLESLPKTSESEGIPTLSQLQKRFEYVRQTARRASFMPENPGLLGHMYGSAVASLTIAPKAPVEGNDVDSILSRASFSLEKGDLHESLKELKNLNEASPYSFEVSKDFINTIETRLKLEQSLNTIQSHISLLASACS